VQRLFSTFADGWPGVGLLVQRILTAILLMRFAVIDLTSLSFTLSIAPQAMGACLGILFLVGLWTPIVGALIAAIELWSTVTYARRVGGLGGKHCNDRSRSVVDRCAPFRQEAH
jgi:hypothetical protein